LFWERLIVLFGDKIEPYRSQSNYVQISYNILNTSNSLPFSLNFFAKQLHLLSTGANFCPEFALWLYCELLAFLSKHHFQKLSAQKG
jgi:hypothetical protein